jgi:hypothetical protein
MPRPKIDDTVLRLAAEQFMHQLATADPRIGLAAHVLDGGNAHMIVEVAIGAAGPERPTLLLDMGGRKQQVLWPRPVRE